MPTPIGLVSEQSSWNYLSQGDNNFTLSDIQQNLLEMSGIPVREASKTDPRIVVALELILKNESSDLTALAEAVGVPRHVYSVPSEIGDYELISLKTAGLVQGHGRSVSITDKGKETIRMFWLDSSNKYKETKTTDKFIHPWNKQASNEANVRTASKKFRQFSSNNTRKFKSEE
jgi:hypothetical protein